MMKNLFIYLFLVLAFVSVEAQQNPIIELEEVIVSDVRVKRYADGHKVTVIKDSTIKRINSSLTSLLAFNSNIYFKENGFGMVSSPSFRGTNASHTAVIWNGININSQLNGQVDFNTISPLGYNSIDIRSGGGSVQFGSGAIGGSVHLNNELQFEKHFKNQILVGYGSYNTQKLNYNQSYGNNRWSSSVGINYTRSDNDYTYLKTDEKNRNGEFENLSLNISAGYVLSDNQVLKMYHQSFIGDRNLSGNLVVLGRSKYKDNHYRTQLEWGIYGDNSSSKIKVAHLQEEFKYFENKEQETFSNGKVTTFLARYALDKKITNKLRLNTFLEYNHYKGEGDSFGAPIRNDLSATVLVKHSVSPSLVYNVSLRQDISSDYSSPMVFSMDSKYGLTDHYSIQLNVSKNFRTPTFNDLYWQPGGNLDLVSEQSYQLDMGHRISYKNISFGINGYYISTKDMIKWLPNTSEIWSPINIDDVQIYGLEGELNTSYSISEKQKVSLMANYAYTVSEDKATNEQLIYVPFHRGNASLTYNLANYGLYYQFMVNGPVSIIGGELKGYNVSNIGFTYSGQIQSKIKYELGITLNNLLDRYYENIALRPMPNRNIQTQLLLNF